MDTLGQMMASELVIQAWRRHPSGGRQVASAILLSGLTLVGASQTADERFPRLFVPLYMAFLLLALARVSRGAALLRWAAVAVALGAGAGTYGAVWMNRVALTTWGTQYLEGRPSPETTGLSAAPTLGDTFGLRGSARRVLRITGLNGVAYLRGIAFDTYQRGQWGPDLERRHFAPARDGKRRRGRPGGSDSSRQHGRTCSRAIELRRPGLRGQHRPAVGAGDRGASCACARPSLRPTDSFRTQTRSIRGRSPHRRRRRSGLAVCSSRWRLIPAFAPWPCVSPGRSVTRSASSAALRTILMAHHRYSLTIHPGPGDPVSRFLLQTAADGRALRVFRCLRRTAAALPGGADTVRRRLLRARGRRAGRDRGAPA